MLVMSRADAKSGDLGGEGGMNAFVRRVESLVKLPAWFVGICFWSVIEAALVRVDSGKLTELLPCPVGVVLAQLLDVAVSLGDIQSTKSRMSHGDTC